jgi:hypothetical protein
MDLLETRQSQKPSHYLLKMEYSYGFNMTILEVMISLLQNTKTQDILTE